MIDIVSAEQGLDLGVNNAETPRAGNILSTQLGSLEYLPEFGIDIAYFLSEDFKFQNASFQAYCVRALANQGVNVASVVPEVQALMQKLTFNVTPNETSTAMVAR
ncbi:putative baseplate wedge protein [Bdellovibrio phage MAC3UK]|nr:putative baseplate wedge protein [Bdellovibrio phage MAC3UK]